MTTTVENSQPVYLYREDGLLRDKLINARPAAYRGASFKHYVHDRDGHRNHSIL